MELIEFVEIIIIVLTSLFIALCGNSFKILSLVTFVTVKTHFLFTQIKLSRCGYLYHHLFMFLKL